MVANYKFCFNCLLPLFKKKNSDHVLHYAVSLFINDTMHITFVLYDAVMIYANYLYYLRSI